MNLIYSDPAFFQPFYTIVRIPIAGRYERIILKRHEIDIEKEGIQVRSLNRKFLQVSR